MASLLLLRLVFLCMFLLPGCVALYVGVRGSEWFFSSQSTHFVQRHLGKRGARLLYTLLGGLLVALGVMGIGWPEEILHE